MGGSSCCDADSCSDGVGNLGVWEGPFVTEFESQLFDQKICLATQETVGGYNEAMDFETVQRLVCVVVVGALVDGVGGVGIELPVFGNKELGGWAFFG